MTYYGLLIFCLQKSINSDKFDSKLGLVKSFVIHLDCRLKIILLLFTVFALSFKNKLSSRKNKKLLVQILSLPWNNKLLPFELHCWFLIGWRKLMASIAWPCTFRWTFRWFSQVLSMNVIVVQYTMIGRF